MTLIHWIGVILCSLSIGCESQSNMTSSLINPNNGPPSFNNSWIDTLMKSSQPNPTLVQGLPSTVTTSSHNIIQGNLSSVDYLPLVMTTMSSAYTELKKDRKSTDSIIIESSKSNEYIQSVVNSNQLFKHLHSSTKLESSGILKNTFTDYVSSPLKTMEDYLVHSHLPVNSDKQFTLSENNRNFRTQYISPIESSFTQNPDSIITSSVYTNTDSHFVSHSSDVLNGFRANTFSTGLTSQPPSFPYLQTPSLPEPSEWHADIFPSIAYDQAMFGDLSNSFEAFYDVDTYKSISIQLVSTLPRMELTPSSQYTLGISSLAVPEIQPSSVILQNVTVTSKFEINSSSSINIPILSSFSYSNFIINMMSLQDSSTSSQTLTLPEISLHVTFNPSYSKTYRKIFSEGILREATLYTSSSAYPSVISTEVFSKSTKSTLTTETTKTLLPKSTTSEPTNVYKDCRFLFTFSGECQLVTNNTLYLAEFIEGLRKTLVEKLHISNDRIKPHDISCGSIKIYVTFKNVSYPETANNLKVVVNSRNFIVPTLIENQVVTFTAQSVEEVELRNGIDSLDLPGTRVENIDIIVIIVACCVCGVLLVIGITVCVKECYRRKYAQSFDLLDMPHVNLKLEDFTLTRIPRPKTSYNNDNVTANPYAERYGQDGYKENGQSASNGNHIDLSDVHVRMQPLNDGIVVGVTGYAAPNGISRKKKHAPSTSSHVSNGDGLGNQSTESLVPGSHFKSVGASNPIFVDDDQASTSTLDISHTQTSLASD